MNVPCGPTAQCLQSASSPGPYPDSNFCHQRSSLGGRPHDLDKGDLDSATTWSTLSASCPDIAPHAYPPGFRCLVTLEEGPVLNLCHLIPKSTTDGMLRRLEHFWGVQPERLDLDTSRNIMILRSDLKLEFDDLTWVLMPPEGLLDRIFEWQRSNLNTVPVGAKPAYLQAFPNQDDWEYIFVPFRLKAPISRRRLVDEGLQQTNSKRDGEGEDGNNDQTQDEGKGQNRGKRDQPKQHVAEQTSTGLPLASVIEDRLPATDDLFGPPYENFPRLKSHIHPFFVAYAAAQAYQNNTHLSLTLSMAPEYVKMGRLARDIKELWQYQDIHHVPQIRNKRALPGKTSGRAYSKRQRTTSTECSPPPDLSLLPKSPPLNLINLELQASLLPSNQGLSRADSAASNPQVLRDSSVTAWVNDVVTRTHSGQLEPLDEAPFWGDIEETLHPLFPESWHSWVNDVHLPKARGLVSSWDLAGCD